MKDSTSISPWTSLVNSRFSETALSRFPRGLHLQTMDSELDSLMQAVFQARRMRNMKAGPCTLPAELIAYIFECLQSDWPPRRGYYDSGDAGFSSGWMCVTHVCSRWREVALNVPSLWSKPTLDILSIPHQYIPDILFRSQSTLFDIKLKWADYPALILTDSRFIAWFSSSICRRARRIEIAAEIELIEHAAELLPSIQDMGQLRELSVKVLGTDDDPGLPVSFRSLPGVTSLTLECCRASWQSPIFSSQLTKLSLSYNKTGLRPSYSDVSTLLARLQSLEMVRLVDVVPALEPNGGHPLAISFPNSLFRLTIAVTNEELALDGLVFISQINTPFLCARNYSLPHTTLSLSTMPLIKDALGRLLPHISFAKCDYIEERHLVLLSDRIRIVGSTLSSSQSTPSFSPADSRLVTNKLEIPDLDEDTPPLSFRLCHYLSIIALEHLHTVSLDLSTVHDLKTNNLWTSLLRANSVRRIGVIRSYENAKHTYLIQLLDALGRRHRVRSFGDKHETRILFPHLESLALPLPANEVLYGEIIDKLICLVEVRQAQGAPLRELVVPKEAAKWSLWSTLGKVLKVSFIDYPWYTSPVTPDSM
ncbi:hypothetical protein PENSPDRAFT_754019 [Peniophora sp. CONT]|nr:hypothetical protein PENSPDRAFT_754019 [Peniophora sp. CONT]